IAKFLPDSNKEQSDYRKQRFQMLFGGIDAVANAAGSGDSSDPIAAALAAHGDSQRNKKKSINSTNFFSTNSHWM
ncbi:hypothetical protein GUITHDRAFT_153477, partial [Guillardia theta CCMP2712]